MEDDYETVPSFQSAFTDALMVADWNLNVEGVRQGMSAKKNISQPYNLTQRDNVPNVLYLKRNNVCPSLHSTMANIEVRNEPRTKFR